MLALGIGAGNGSNQAVDGYSWSLWRLYGGMYALNRTELITVYNSLYSLSGILKLVENMDNTSFQVIQDTRTTCNWTEHSMSLLIINR